MDVLKNTTAGLHTNAEAEACVLWHIQLFNNTVGAADTLPRLHAPLALIFAPMPTVDFFFPVDGIKRDPGPLIEHVLSDERILRPLPTDSSHGGIEGDLD